MDYNFDIFPDRTGSNSVKWELGNEVIPMWVADMDIPTATPILEAMHSYIDTLVCGYTSISDSYINAAINWYKQYGANFTADMYIYCDGVVSGFTECINAFSKDGEGVIVMEPVYTPFFGATRGNKRDHINCALLKDDSGYHIDFDALEKYCKIENNKILLLCSPHNPVGRVFTKDELKKIADICYKNNVIIVCDEIHCDLSRTGIEFTSLDAVANPTQKYAVINAPSKTFNVPGLHMANIFVPNTELRNILKSNIGHYFPNPIAQEGATAAYASCNDWLAQLKVYLDNNFTYCKEFFDKNFAKAKFYIPDGTYLAWVDFSQYDKTSQELVDLFLEKDVRFSSGAPYGEGGEGYLRLNLAMPKPLLKAALDRIKDAL